MGNVRVFVASLCLQVCVWFVHHTDGPCWVDFELIGSFEKELNRQLINEQLIC